MRSKQGLLGLFLLVLGCLDSHERDNPLDGKSSQWNESLYYLQPDISTFAAGDPDTVAFSCTALELGSIVQFVVKYDDGSKVWTDTSTDGSFSVYLGQNDIGTTCTVIDKSGSRMTGLITGGLHRNHPPVIDSLPYFDSWTELDIQTEKGKGMVLIPVSDEDDWGASGVHDYFVRVDIDGVKGKWDTLGKYAHVSHLKVPVFLSYRSTPHYRMVVRDYYQDSAVVEGILALDTISSCKHMGPTTFVDSRDGQEYSCVWLGGRSWMTENVNYGQVVPTANAQGDNLQVERYCPGDSAEGCEATGAYYQWAEAMGEAYSCNKTGTCAMEVHSPQGVCPPGWHIPSKDEWETLPYNTSSGDPFFKNVMHGYVDLDGVIQKEGRMAFFWTTTTEAETSALDHSVSVRYSQGDSLAESLGFRMEVRRLGLSVRCVMD